MTDHDPDQDDALKELDAALRVQPSRAFADGVRARVEQSHRRNRNMWWGLAAAASLGLATLALWRPLVETPVQMVAAPVQAPVPAVRTVTPDPVAAIARVRPFVPEGTATSPEPRLEVITNQGALLRQMWVGVDPGGMVETVAEAAVPVPAVKVKPIAPIVLDPIVVTPIVVGEIGNGGGRGGATPAIRRVDATKETR